MLSKGGSAENERKARVAANLRALADDADKVRASPGSVKRDLQRDLRRSVL